MCSVVQKQSLFMSTTLLWQVTTVTVHISEAKKALRETQNLRAGCIKAAQLLDVAKRPIPQG